MNSLCKALMKINVGSIENGNNLHVRPIIVLFWRNNRIVWEKPRVEWIPNVFTISELLSRKTNLFPNILSTLRLTENVSLVASNQWALEGPARCLHVFVVYLRLHLLTKDVTQVTAQPLSHPVLASVVLAKTQYIFLVIQQILRHVVDESCVSIIQRTVTFELLGCWLVNAHWTATVSTWVSKLDLLLLGFKLIHEQLGRLLLEDCWLQFNFNILVLNAFDTFVD